MKNYTLPILFACAVYLFCITSCSTRKNNFATRSYHTVTATYNVNFNGKEALKKGEEELSKKRKDNYLARLPVYHYPVKQDVTSSFPSFDRAIEKASKSVFKHSILIRGKEYVKPMNTAYLMMGKAYFYKQDYVQAKRVFNYITATYKDWGSVEEATIWLARCEMRSDYFVRAQSFLEDAKNLINKKKKKDKKVMLQLHATLAEYNLLAPNGDKEEAIDNIKLALTYKPKKEFRVRLYFILAQLYEEMEKQADAQKWFLKVIKSTPSYDMEFSARMHLASNYDGSNVSRVLIVKELKKMLKDQKNEDYRDQIYYAFSEIDRIDDDDVARMFHLAQSVAAYTNNDYQRSHSALTLADIFFEEEEYLKAQKYYDTTMLTLPKNFPNYDAIVKKASILRDLVDNLQIIALEDSLQRIAKMSDGQRKAWVNKMIANYTEEERRMAKEEADRQLALNATREFANVDVNTQGTSNKWYFYNQGLISAGATDFYRRFGNRKLEDNWRISNKNVISFEDMALLNDGGEKEEEEELDEDGNPIKKRETDPKKPEYYTQDLPLTPGAIDTSNMRIADAMYNAAIIYFDQLNDLKRSNEMFEKLINRYPDNQFVAASYFLLWVNYTKLKQPVKAEAAKNIILTKYPDSDYAKLILDPDYYKKLAELAKENERRYESLYQAYSSKNWGQTVQLADGLLPLVEQKALQSKVAYLRAIAVGQVSGEGALKIALQEIVNNYGSEQVAELARLYLSMISKPSDNKDITSGLLQNENLKNAPPAESIYNKNIDEQHYIIIIVNVHKLNITNFKSDVNIFNTTYFSLERFNINSFYVSQDEQLVTVARFKNKRDVMTYYDAMIYNDVFVRSIDNKEITIYPISASNYSLFYNKVNERPSYKQFFEENYLK